jgi:ketosteroid isomerase-like protein
MFKLEPAITAMIDATNRGDTEAFLAAFNDDATVVDFGRTFRGKRGIARWNSDENIGTHNFIRLTGVTRSENQVRVAVLVSGNGYNGPGMLSFELEGDLIKRLVIT